LKFETWLGATSSLNSIVISPNAVEILPTSLVVDGGGIGVELVEDVK